MDQDFRAGDQHYMAYVGSPQQYDVIGASQFNLLTTLGLRASHTLLDVGCGSLRAGRFFLCYLNPGCYFGIEPNKWLIEEAISQQVGADMIRIKQPTFDDNSDFNTSVFGVQFDFILAQSILSHTGNDQVSMALSNFNKSLKDDGLMVVNFREGKKDYQGDGWVYPELARYRPRTIAQYAEQQGLFSVRIPWYHPRLTWYVMSRNKQRLPSADMLSYLRGEILFAPELPPAAHIKFEEGTMLQRVLKSKRLNKLRRMARRILPTSDEKTG